MITQENFSHARQKARSTSKELTDGQPAGTIMSQWRQTLKDADLRWIADTTIKVGACRKLTVSQRKNVSIVECVGKRVCFRISSRMARYRRCPYFEKNPTVRRNTIGKALFELVLALICIEIARLGRAGSGGGTRTPDTRIMIPLILYTNYLIYICYTYTMSRLCRIQPKSTRSAWASSSASSARGNR